MAKKKFEPYIAEGVEIVDIAHDGRAIGKHEDRVIFVDKAVPGDVVDINVLYRKKQLFEGKINVLHKASEYRSEPFCSHFGVCGGCKWQHLSYEAQLKFKQKQVVDALERIGGISTKHLTPIFGSEKTTYYRNKMEFTFSNKRWLTEEDMINRDDLEQSDALGFHVPLRFDKIIDIQHCYLQQEPSNEIRNAVRTYALEHKLSFYDLKEHQGFLRNLIIRTASTGELMVIVVFAEHQEKKINGLMKHLNELFPQITSLLYIVNQKRNDTIFDQEVITFNGRDHIFEEMEGIKFKISPKSFYQTNSEQAYHLYKITREFADLKGHELVYDLYTGAGTIANFVARNVKQVVGVEYVPDAIEDAKINSAINGIENTLFYAGDMKDVLNAEFIAQHGKPDVVITDPPRAGMHADVVERINEMEPEKIVYVSCNPATQARDLALLKEKYEVVKIQPVDMFPQTVHVENVVLLKRK
ncbi:23S rRNA (uracil(1939)-C(5))-methyltransferase RlmD [Solitalea longa]|uniref:23S rRNA (Uracil(1939)-C(5))-methyltransferase RlmD n=1 Tax=Solitalea longa TaxID=2079460 RepID=A0A2S5A9T0_9SPHI|nr:23S rRNA (uracil(1939)-C(5))-methyltransferase RlmD [Solitalea longa]POY39338.1 23S rRNA (uracil(1939)-C(5))-methyltransferase RlmD [Solitalea longa]